MKIIRPFSKPAAFFLAIYMLILTGPFQTGWAAMISTESVITAKQSQIAREYVNNLLMRQDLQLALASQGIDPQEAKARIKSLSDAEVNEIADKLDQLPAGATETSIIIILVVFLIFVILDIAGFMETPDSE